MPFQAVARRAHPSRGRMPQDMGADGLRASRGRGIRPAEGATDQVVS